MAPHWIDGVPRPRALLRHAGGSLNLDLCTTPLDGGTRIDWSLRSDEPLELDAAFFHFPAWLKAPRALLNGFQSWTPTRVVPPGHANRRAWLRTFELMTHNVDSPWYGRRDGFASHGFTLLQEGEKTWLLGFLSSFVGLPEIFVSKDHVVASLDYGGKLLRAGEELRGEPLWIAPGGTPERWAELAAREHGVRPGQDPSPVGWCSWYQYHTGITESQVLANLDFLVRHPHLGVEVLQLDDGYQTAVGDWLSLNRKFPRGLAPMARAIDQAGFQAGIWTAPFFASRRSRLLARHPECFLRDTRGRLVDCGFNPVWRTRLVALDPTHPLCRSWLADVFTELCEAGFNYHKIDFLFAGLRRGRHHDPHMSPTQAYRAGLAVIRDAIGPGRFLLGCGAPLMPSLGFFQAMRVSQDVREAWDDPLFRLLGRDTAYPSARGAIRNVITRSFLHGRWWINDPDCLLVRDRKTRLSSDQVRTLLTILGMSGGMLFLSDDLSSLSPHRLELARSVLPPGSLSARAPDLLRNEYPEYYELNGPGGRLVARIAWDRDLSWDEPGFDFWNGTMVNEPCTVRRHCVATRLQATGPLKGTDLHLLAIVDGRLRGYVEAGKLLIHGKNMARRSGRVWVHLPGGSTLGAPLPSGVSLVGSWDEGAVLHLDAPSWPWQVSIPLLD